MWEELVWCSIALVVFVTIEVKVVGALAEEWPLVVWQEIGVLMGTQLDEGAVSSKCWSWRGGSTDVSTVASWAISADGVLPGVDFRLDIAGVIHGVWAATMRNLFGIIRNSSSNGGIFFVNNPIVSEAQLAWINRGSRIAQQNPSTTDMFSHHVSIWKGAEDVLVCRQVSQGSSSPATGTTYHHPCLRCPQASVPIFCANR